MSCTTLPTRADDDLDTCGNPVRAVVARWIRIPRWRWAHSHPARPRGDRDPVSRHHGSTTHRLTKKLRGCGPARTRAGHACHLPTRPDMAGTLQRGVPALVGRACPLPGPSSRHRLLAHDERGA